MKPSELIITKYDLLFESRLTKVETTISNVDETLKEIKSELKSVKSEMKTDFRWMLGMMIALFGLMAHGFKWF